MKIISVFGSNRPKPGQADFEQACELGKHLAQAGFAVATGGYMGTMEAVSQGAAQVGGHVIGVTCDEIERWRPIGPNPWVTQEIRYPTLLERMTHLVTQNDGVIALPGGVGTLAEVAQTWSFLQTGVLSPRPFILLGEIWQRTFEAFIDPAYVRSAHQTLFHLADTPQAAVALLKQD